MLTNKTMMLKYMQSSWLRSDGNKFELANGTQVDPVTVLEAEEAGLIAISEKDLGYEYYQLTATGEQKASVRESFSSSLRSGRRY